MIERLVIERFAPGFRDLIIGRSTRTATAMEAYDANYVGGGHGMSGHLATRSGLRREFGIR